MARDLSNIQTAIFSLSAQWAYNSASKKGEDPDCAEWQTELDLKFPWYYEFLKDAAKA
jgi:hypothetical protein